MSTGWIVIGVIVIVVLFAFAAYNRLVALSQRVGQAFADVDVQLKQRHDLIPNLVETVKGYASHERGTLDDVIKARNSAMSAQGPAQVSAAENQLSGALGRLIALSEAYRTSRPTPISSSSPANCPTSRTRSRPAAASSTTRFRNTTPGSSRCRPGFLPACSASPARSSLTSAPAAPKSRRCRA
jgi:LemA family